MMDRKALATLLGFAFVAAWIGFGFGDAILCVIGAAVFYAVMAFVEGDLDLVEVQSRVQRRGGSGAPPPPPPRTTPRVR